MYADDLAGVAEGDEASLARIIAEFGPLVRSIALRVTGNEADADDVAQEIFIGLPEALESFSGGNFPGWLKVVTRNHARMLMRSEERRQGLTLLPQADGSTERTLDRITITRALEEIDDRLREVFLLRWQEGLSHQEIAELMGISENYSQVLLHRARKALRNLLS